MVMGQPLKFGTPEKRRAMWDAFCQHGADGYSIKSFPLCDEDTCYSYAERFPEDCPRSEFNDAKRKGLLFWEKIGTAGATGKLDGFNATSWIFNMKNRAGWSDKVDTTMSGPNGGPVKTEMSIDVTSSVLQFIPTEDLRKIVESANKDNS